MESTIKGKIALVTGATGGIGRSCAYKLAALGANVIIAGRRTNLLEEVKQDIETKYGVKVLPITLDVTDAKAVLEKLGKLPKEWEDVSILVNNAGLAKGVDFVHNVELEDIDAMIDTNIKGFLYVNKAIVPKMLERNTHGTIITMGSVAGNQAYTGGGIYCATKAAVRFLADAMRIELVASNLRVTNIEPGIVETNFSVVRYKGDEEKAAKVYSNIEALTPDDIADTVAYVCSLPQNVQIPEIIMTPNKQADALHKHLF